MSFSYFEPVSGFPWSSQLFGVSAGSGGPPGSPTLFRTTSLSCPPARLTSSQSSLNPQCWLRILRVCVFQSRPTLCGPMGCVARQVPPSMGFPRQEYWSGLLCLSPGDLPNPGIKPMSPALAGGFFTTGDTWHLYLIPSPPIPLLFLKANFYSYFKIQIP